MKTFLTIVCSLLTCSGLFAQLPEKGNSQVSFGIQSHNNALLIFKHYYRDKAAYRLGISGSYSYYKNPMETYYNSPNNFYSLTQYNRNENFAIRLGLQKSFSLLENLEPYVGTDLVIGNSYRKNYRESNYQNGDYEIVTSSQSFFPTVSFNPLIGINFYLKKNFAIGAEYQIGLIYASLNGKNAYNYFSSSNGNTTTAEINSRNGFGLGTSVTGSGGITVSYFFK